MNSWQHITILHCSLFLFSSLLHACLSCFSSRKDQIFGQQDFIFKFFFSIFCFCFIIICIILVYKGCIEILICGIACI